MKWPTSTIGAVCEVVSGATPKTGNPSFWDGDIHWVTPKDLSVLQQKLLEDTPRKITKKGLQSCSARILPPQSVLFSSRAPIGLVAINSIPVCTNQGFKSMVPRVDLLSADYLFWWLKTHREDIERLGRGATFKEVSKKIVEDITFPLPPLGEQKRIAAILDAADALRAKRRETLAQLDTLLQSTFLDMFGDPVTNPKGWAFKELAELVKAGTIVTYGIVQAGEEYPEGIPYIRTGDIANGVIKMEGLRHTDPEIAAKFERSRVRTGEIVISIRATVGTTALVPPELDGSNLTQGTARISPGENTASLFLLHFIRTKGCQGWINKQIKGATFREITLKRLRQMPVFVPPLPLQRRFAAIVESVEQQKTRLRAHLAELDTLFASLQDRAFKGAL